MNKVFIFILLLICTICKSQILTNSMGHVIKSNNSFKIIPSNGIYFKSIQGSTSISNVSIVLRLDIGKSCIINWGDGTISTANGSGSNITYTSNYSNAYLRNNTLYLSIIGDLDYIKRFEITNQATIFFTNTSQLNKLTRLQELVWNGSSANFISLNLNDISNTLIYFDTNLSNITGSVNLKTNLTHLQSIGSTNSLSGNINGLTSLQWVYLAPQNSVTGDITLLTSLQHIQAIGSNNIIGSVTNLTSLNYLWLLSCSGSITNLTQLTYLSSGGSLSGSITNLTLLQTVNLTGVSHSVGGSITGCTQLNFMFDQSNGLSGDISSLTQLTYVFVSGTNTITGLPNNLHLLGTFVLYGSNNVSGSLNISACTTLTDIRMFNNSGITSFTTVNSASIINKVYLYNCNIDKFDFTNSTNISADVQIYNNANDTALIVPTTLNKAFTNIDAHGNALNKSSVDNLLHRLYIYFNAHAPIANLTVYLSGGTNSIPTGSLSNTDIVGLDTIFNAAGKTFTFKINYTAFSPSVTTPDYSANAKILGIDGQSNAVGNCFISDLNSMNYWLLAQQDGVYTTQGVGSNFSTWSMQHLLAGTNNNLTTSDSTNKTNFGVELKFGNAQNALHTDNKLYISKTGWAGTAISSHMKGDASGRYTLFVNKINNIISRMTAPVHVVIFWDQGESDGISSVLANAYQSNLTTLITNWRADINATNIKVVIRKMRPTVTGDAYISTIITAQNNIVAGVSNCYLLNCDDVVNFDGMHFDAIGMVEIGRRLSNLVESNNLWN